MKKKVAIRPTGSCFDDSLDYLAFLVKERPERAYSGEFRLAHGILSAPDGEPYSHAWVEERGSRVWTGGILDGVRGYFAFDKVEYYAEMTVTDVTLYSVAEVWRQNYRSGHYGPWEEKYRSLCRDVQAGALVERRNS